MPSPAATPADAGQGEGLTLPQLAGIICHRAKNDLLTLANLLALAAPRFAKPEDLARAMEPRIMVLSTAYTLVSSQGVAPNLQALGKEVARRAAAQSPLPLRPRLDLPQEPMSLRLCSPLSLWLYEVALNAATHGAEGHPAPRLEIGAELSPQGLTLWVRDTGPGLPPGLDPAGRNGLGLMVAHAVASRDLGGSMRFTPLNPGLEVTLEVPRHEFDQLNRSRWT